MMGMLEGSGYEKTGAGSAASIHYVAEAMRRYYADRSEYLGRSRLLQGSDRRRLLDPQYIADAARQSIDPRPRHAERSDPPGQTCRPASAPRRRTINIVDAEGNAVAVTYTLNGGYGSGVTVPGLGFLLNNEMDDLRPSRASRTCSGWCRARQRDPARQAAALVHDADHRAARTASCSWWWARRADRASSTACCR